MSGRSLNPGKPETLNWFRSNENNISKILDIGAGSGTYIKLIKIKNEVCQKAKWTAIEAWKPYIEKYKLESIYDRVINQDARKIDWKTLGHFDVVIAGDVLEHMSKEDAIELVENILNNANTLIISIPIVHMPQEELDGNPFEIHIKDDWSHDEVLNTWGNYIKNSYRKGKKTKIGVYWLSKK